MVSAKRPFVISRSVSTLRLFASSETYRTHGEINFDIGAVLKSTTLSAERYYVYYSTPYGLDVLFQTQKIHKTWN